MNLPRSLYNLFNIYNVYYYTYFGNKPKLILLNLCIHKIRCIFVILFRGTWFLHCPGDTVLVLTSRYVA